MIGDMVEIRVLVDLLVELTQWQNSCKFSEGEYGDKQIQSWEILTGSVLLLAY
jgi:hypothetical protein